MSLLVTRRNLLAMLGGTLLAGKAKAAGEAAYAGWFKYGPELEKIWRFAEAPGDPNSVLVDPVIHDSVRIPKVLVLYPRASTAYDVAITRILTVFDSKDFDASVTVVNYAGEDMRAKSAVEEAERAGVNLILAMGSESVTYLWKNYRGGRIPVVTACAKDPVLLKQMPSYDHGSGTNFAFTSLNMPIDAQMGYVLELRPQVKNIAVLVDRTNVSAVETQSKPVAEYGAARNIRVMQLAVENPRNARQELESLVSHAVTAMRRNDPTLENSLFWITGSTSVFDEIATIIAKSETVPVLSVVPEVVKEGENSAVLSIGVSFESNAHLAAIYAADVLEKGADVATMKVGLVSPPDIAINFLRARKIGLRIPFNFFQSATNIFGYDGKPLRLNGVNVAKS